MKVVRSLVGSAAIAGAIVLGTHPFSPNTGRDGGRRSPQPGDQPAKTTFTGSP
jgi:hypothetical protein